MIIGLLGDTVDASGLVDWYRDHTDWWQAAKDGVEQKYAATEKVIG